MCNPTCATRHEMGPREQRAACRPPACMLGAGALSIPRQKAVAAARHWRLSRCPRECDRLGSRLPDRPLPAECTALRILLPQARFRIARLPKLAAQLASSRDGPHRLLPLGAAEPRARGGCELLITFGRTFGPYFLARRIFGLVLLWLYILLMSMNLRSYLVS